MADYPIISDVSAYIVRTLRKKMCPEPIPSPNNIEISSPADQDVDYILGLYLYDIREESVVSQAPFIPKGRVDTQEPPIVLSQAKISLEEKVRVWQAINKPYQISLFYKAAPVYLSSEVVINTPRVAEASFALHIAGEEGGET